jgi:hypothetical protein
MAVVSKRATAQPPSENLELILKRKERIVEIGFPSHILELKAFVNEPVPHEKRILAQQALGRAGESKIKAEKAGLLLAAGIYFMDAASIEPINEVKAKDMVFAIRAFRGLAIYLENEPESLHPEIINGIIRHSRGEGKQLIEVLGYVPTLNQIQIFAAKLENESRVGLLHHSGSELEKWLSTKPKFEMPEMKLIKKVLVGLLLP